MAITAEDIATADIDGSSKFLLTALLAEIDELKARPAARQAVKYVITYDDGTSDIFDLVSGTP